MNAITYTLVGDRSVSRGDALTIARQAKDETIERIKMGDYENDRRLAQVERARLIPPDELPDDEPSTPIKETEAQRDWRLSQERAAIRDHMRRYKCDEGLFGEAINEHELAPAIRAAVYASDSYEVIGRLVVRAICEYIGSVIARDKDYHA